MRRFPKGLDRSSRFTEEKGLAKLWQVVRRLWDREFAARDTIRICEELYEFYRRHYPNVEPHDLLALVLVRMSKHENAQKVAAVVSDYDDTRILACIPPPDCAWALGTWVVYKSDPGTLEKLVDVQERFNLLISPVWQAQAEGRYFELYAVRNPILASKEYAKDVSW